MSVEGPSFDGITDQDGGGSSIVVDNQATNYIATNESNQYATNKPNLDLVANSTNPIFSLKGLENSVVGELRAAKVTLTQSSSSTINAIADLSAPNLTAGKSAFLWLGKDFAENGNKGYLAYTHKDDQNEVALGFYNLGSPLVIREPTADKASSVRVNGELVCDNNSQTNATLSLTNQNAETNTGLQILAPNIATGKKTSITLGRDISNPGNSYTFSSIYSTTAADKRLEINSFGGTEPIIKAYTQATPSTSATTGSVVVPGDLTSSTKVSSKELVLYGSTSGSASINSPSTISTPYKLTLPNTLGTNGQALTMGTPVGNTAPLNWSNITSGSTGLANQAMLSRYNNATQTVANNTNYIVKFNTEDGMTNGNVGLTYTNTDGRFTNNTGYTVTYIINPQITYQFISGGSRMMWVSRNDDYGWKYGLQQLKPDTTAGDLTLCTSTQITLLANQWFTVLTYQNIGSDATLGSSSSQGTKIQVSLATGSAPTPSIGVVGRTKSANQTLTTGTDTVVIFENDDTDTSLSNVPISYNSSNYRFTNTAGYTTTFQIAYQVVFAYFNQGNRLTWIEKNGINTKRYGYNITPPCTVSSQSTIINGFAYITIANNEYFRLFAYQNHGSNLDLLGTTNNAFDVTKIQITQVVGTIPPTGIQTLTLNTPSSLFSISGSPTSGSTPTISIGTNAEPTGTGSKIVLATSPTINSATLSGTTIISGNATLAGQSTIANALVTKFVEQATVIEDPSEDLNLSSTSETSWIFKSIGSSYSVKLPSEPTITIGSKYKFVNQTALDISIRNQSVNNTLLYVLKAKATVECLLISSAETVISWKFIPVLYDTITSTTEEFKIGKGGFVYENTAAKLVLGNADDKTIRIYPHSSQSNNYDFILPTNMGTSGQVLTSQGSGNPLAWSESLNNLSVLNITSTGNTISNNSGEVLKISGQERPFTVENTATTGPKITSINLTPNLSANELGSNTNVMIQGKELAPNQCIYQNFNYISPYSSLNYWSMGLYFKQPTIEVREANLSFTNAKQSFTVEGGIESTYLKTQMTQINQAGNTIYNTLNSTEPNLKIITQANSNTPLKIENNSSSSVCSVAELTAPNLTAAQSTFLWMGKDFSQNGNMGYLAYSYQNTPSAQNELALGFNNDGSSLVIRKAFQNADSDATSSVRVNGGLVCDSFRATGSISGPIKTSDLTTTSDIKFDKGNGQFRNLTFDYGRATPTFWWAYNTADKSCNFSYPSVGEQIANRKYYWQQTGKQYSFYLQLKVEITSSDTLPVVFIDNCNPPIPGCGPYVVTEGAPYLPGQSPVPSGLGLYIPAT